MTTIVTRSGKGSPLTHTEVDTNFTNLNTAKLETAAIPLGTLQAPSVSFLNDSDTGIFCPQGGNSLAIATGGQYAITCTSTQAVGIQTANPNAALHVAGNARVGADDVTDAVLEIGAGASGNRTSYIDIVADTTYTDYGLRIIRNNTGANATSELKHRGTGALNFTTEEAAPIVFYTTNSPRATIDSDGRLLVGTSTNFDPSANIQAQGEGLALKRNENGSTISNGLIRFYSGAGLTAQIFGVNDGAQSPGDTPGALVFSTTADEAATPTERMRITSYGTFLASNAGSYPTTTGTYHAFSANSPDDLILRLNNTSSTNPYGVNVVFDAAAPNDTTRFFLNCADNAALRATIRSNGGLANYSANNANLSDRNVKKDISPAANTWNCIKEWEIVNYRYKDQPDDADLNLGVIAQQVAESCPEVITIFQEAKEATEDKPAQEERLGVKEQQMYWMAIKALQEAMGRIEQLETKVAALESA
jgi:hypothetical protein